MIRRITKSLNYYLIQYDQSEREALIERFIDSPRGSTLSQVAIQRADGFNSLMNCLSAKIKWNGWEDNPAVAQSLSVAEKRAN